jgi:hypothetical protein
MYRRTSLAEGMASPKRRPTTLHKQRELRNLVDGLNARRQLLEAQLADCNRQTSSALVALAQCKRSNVVTFDGADVAFEVSMSTSSVDARLTPSPVKKALQERWNAVHASRKQDEGVLDEDQDGADAFASLTNPPVPAPVPKEPVATTTAVMATAIAAAGYKTPPPTAAALRSMSSSTTNVVDLVSPRSTVRTAQLPYTSPNRFHRLPPGAPPIGTQTPIQKSGNISVPRRDLGGAKLLSASYDGKSNRHTRDQLLDPWALVWAATTSASLHHPPEDVGVRRKSSYLSQFEGRRPQEASRVVTVPRSAPSARNRYETKMH